MNTNSELSKSFFLLIKDEKHLQTIAEQYPWCSLAQFYLLCHYKKNGSIQFENQAPKTALLFNNTNWLNWQLHLNSKENIISENIEIDNSKNEIEQFHHSAKIENHFSEIPQTNISEETIAFEPLHTIDYFASQGIKLTDESMSNDKLGSQMKSFTEWLKSMKKIHKENLQAADEQTDKNIQNIAEVSNTDADIATESMADVLIKQNKIEKAIEVYNKLSLLYPSKNAYFATKINGLKTH